jgi:hypothetical protein
LTSVSSGSITISASAVTFGTFDVARIPTGTTSSTVSLGNHVHGNITNAGAIGNASGQIVVTTTSGVLTTAATISSSQVSGLGSLATQSSVAYSSLTGTPSTFAPSAHKTSHATGGSDALTASDIGAAASSHAHAASDITSGTVATARLGSGTANSSTYLRGDQTWATVSGESFHPFLLAGM